jgi:hypothetical protein
VVCDHKEEGGAVKEAEFVREYVAMVLEILNMRLDANRSFLETEQDRAIERVQMAVLETAEQIRESGR